MRKYEYISCDKNRGYFLKEYLLVSIQRFPKTDIYFIGYDEGCWNSPKAGNLWLFIFRKGSINSFSSSMCRLFQPLKGRACLLFLNMAAFTFSQRKLGTMKEFYSEMTVQGGNPSHPKGKEPRKSISNKMKPWPCDSSQAVLVTPLAT